MRFMLDVMATVDFSREKDFSLLWNWTFWLFVAAVILTVIIYLVTKEAMVIVFGFFGFFFGMFFVIVFTSVSVQGFPKSQVQSFQTWAADTYLLDLNYGDAKNLLYSQRDITGDDTPADKLDKQRLHAVRTIYGDKVKAGLVQNGDEWKMIMLHDIAMSVPKKSDSNQTIQ